MLRLWNVRWGDLHLLLDKAMPDLDTSSAEELCAFAIEVMARRLALMGATAKQARSAYAHTPLVLTRQAVAGHAFSRAPGSAARSGNVMSASHS